MFENRQDTTILRDALMSASKYLKSKQGLKENFDLEDEEEALKIVVSTISSLSCSLYAVNNILELFEKQLDFNRRCHAVVFINLLNSQNINSPEASTFYESVLYDVPYLTWNFYLKLNFMCHWSEHFIECAQQLQPSALTAVLKHLLEVTCDGELKYYTWHLVLQTYMWKTFIVESPSLCNSEMHSPFQFKFDVGEHLPVENLTEEELNNDKIGHLSSIYNIILNNLIHESEQSIDVNFIKVIFHGFKTLFKLFNTICGSEGPDMKTLIQLKPLFVQCLTSEAAKTVILTGLDKDEKCMIDSCYQTTSWEISEKYLIFLLQNLWKDIGEKPSNCCEDKNVPKTIGDYCNAFHSNIESENVSYKTLVNLIEVHINYSEDFMRKYFLLLYNVVKYHYPYASRADQYLLSNPLAWDLFNILDLQEQNLSVLDPFDVHSVLADCVVNEGTKEKRERILKIYHKILSKGPLEIYNCAIKNIFNKWGYCNYFVLPNFHSQLAQFKRKAMSLKESEECLLPLLVQLPRFVLHYLIEQAVMQGAEGMQMIQVLKTVPIVCLHKTKEEKSTPLVTEICPYFKHNLTTHKAKNFLLLLRSLFEVKAKEDILPFDIFLEKCIFPNLVLTNINKLEYTLECLKVALDVLIKERCLEISSEKYIDLIQHLGKIINFSIENNLGKFKESVLRSLELAAKYDNKPKLVDILKANNDEETWYNNQNDVVNLYILGIFFKNFDTDESKEVSLWKWIEDVTEKRFDLLLIWCTITDNDNFFKEKIRNFKNLSYENLLETLQSLLWHFTKSEWLLSLNHIATCYDVLKPMPPQYPWTLSKSNITEYFTVRCLIDSFFIIMQEESTPDIIHTCDYLTNAIMNLLSKGTTYLILHVFLDLCHLLSLMDSKVIQMFSTLLMSIIKIVLPEKFDVDDCSFSPKQNADSDKETPLSSSIMKNCDKIEKLPFIKLMQLGVSSLPNSEEKETLMIKINKE